MGAPVQLDVEKNGKQVKFILSGEKIALLIGKRGQTLNSLAVFDSACDQSLFWTIFKCHFRC